MTQAQVELANGMRLDTNYYFWPPTFVLDRPGFFTGSGMPMRFVDTNGTMIDVYQATSQMTDESGQSYPGTINTLLDNAVGPQGYYGAFTANFHTDSAIRPKLLQASIQHAPMKSRLFLRCRCSPGLMAVTARHSAP